MNIYSVSVENTFVNFITCEWQSEQTIDCFTLDKNKAENFALGWSGVVNTHLLKDIEHYNPNRGDKETAFTIEVFFVHPDRMRRSKKQYIVFAEDEEQAFAKVKGMVLYPDDETSVLCKLDVDNWRKFED